MTAPGERDAVINLQAAVARTEELGGRVDPVTGEVESLRGQRQRRRLQARCLPAPCHQAIAASSTSARATTRPI